MDHRLKKIRRKAAAVSNVGFIFIVIVLLIAASGGWGLWSYNARTGVSTTTVFVSTTVSNITTAINALSREAVSAAFYNGTIVTFLYPKEYNCTPALTTYYPSENSSVANLVTNCEVGQGNQTAEQGAVPLWVVVPAYAGLSVFGVRALGASSQGFPTFDNVTLATDCGAGGTIAACPDHPTFLYSPFFTSVEQHIGITNGYGGLPEGVLPTPSHDHIINCCFTTIPWYTIVVLNFDPNIMPNAVTGECAQVAPSNLTKPTANCLNSFQGLITALTTNNTALKTIDANNPIWQTLGGPTTQIVIPGAATAAQINNANSNLFEHFTVNSSNPYLPANQNAP